MRTDLAVVGHLGRDVSYRDSERVDAFYGGSLLHWMNGFSFFRARAAAVTSVALGQVRPVLDLWTRLGHDVAGVADALEMPEFHCRYRNGVFDEASFEALHVPDLGTSLITSGVEEVGWLHVCPLPIPQLKTVLDGLDDPSVTVSLQTHGSLFRDEGSRECFMRTCGRAEVVFFSASEARLVSGEDEIERACEFTSRLARHVFVTDEIRARVIVDGQVGPWVPSFPTYVVDPTGAGDTFAGAAVGALLSGASPSSTLLAASALATHAVGGSLGRALYERLDSALS
jgi:hypothetical protein